MSWFWHFQASLAKIANNKNKKKNRTKLRTNCFQDDLIILNSRDSQVFCSVTPGSGTAHNISLSSHMQCKHSMPGHVFLLLWGTMGKKKKIVVCYNMKAEKLERPISKKKILLQFSFFSLFHWWLVLHNVMDSAPCLWEGLERDVIYSHEIKPKRKTAGLCFQKLLQALAFPTRPCIKINKKIKSICITVWYISLRNENSEFAML